MRQGRLGITHSCKRTDVCEICTYWIRHSAPEIHKTLASLFRMLEACYPELGELPDTDPNNPLNFKKWNPEDIEEPDKIKALKAAVEAFLDTKPGTPGAENKNKS